MFPQLNLKTFVFQTVPYMTQFRGNGAYGSCALYFSLGTSQLQ